MLALDARVRLPRELAEDDEGVSALARTVADASSATCATERGSIAHIDARAPRAPAFVLRAPVAREVNAMVWTSDRALWCAVDDRVVELDARMVSSGEAADGGGRAETRALSGHGDVVNGIDVDVGGRFLAACDDSGEIVVYELSSGSVTRRLRGHEGCATSVAFRRKRGAEGEMLTTATDCRAMKWDHKLKSVPVRTWDARKMKSVTDHDRERAGSSDEAGESGDAKQMFNPPMLHSVSVFAGETSEENVPGLRRAACAACGDGTVLVFDVDQKPLQPSSFGGSKKSSSSAKSASGGVFRDGKAECVRLGSDGVSGHTNAVTCAAFVPWLARGDIVVSGGADRKLIAWNWVKAAEAAPSDPDASAAGVMTTVALRRKVNDLAFANNVQRIVVADTGPHVSFYAFRD